MFLGHICKRKKEAGHCATADVRQEESSESFCFSLSPCRTGFSQNQEKDFRGFPPFVVNFI